MNDIGRLRIAQQILEQSTDFLRRIIASIDGMEGVTLSNVCPHCNCFHLDDCTSCVSTGHGGSNNRKKNHSNQWCAACGGPYEWRALNKILVVQLGVNANEAKVFKTHAAPLGLCDHLINALKLLARQQKDGDSPTQSTVASLHERSRRGIMDGLRRFIRADNHSAVDVGDLRSFEVQKPQISDGFIKAAIREGADELTLRADEVDTQRTFTDTEHNEFEVRTAASLCGLAKLQTAKALWAMKPAWDRGEECYDPGHEEDVLGRTNTLLDLWEVHLKHLIVALAKAVACLENLHLSWHLVSQLVVASFCRRNGFQHSWRKDFAKDVGRALLECPGEIWATQQPFLLPYQ